VGFSPTPDTFMEKVTVSRQCKYCRAYVASFDEKTTDELMREHVIDKHPDQAVTDKIFLTAGDVRFLKEVGIDPWR